jgi:hypothetical protein
MADQSKPEDANKYIRPDPKPYIDHQKEADQKRIWRKGLELLEGGYIDEFLKFLDDSGLTSEQRARAREIVKTKYRI